MEFLLVHNVSMPYVRPCGHHMNDTGLAAIDEADTSIRNSTLFNNDRKLKFDSEKIGYDSFRLHEKLATSLDIFADCDCRPRQGSIKSGA